jgi:hypothetical protein
MALSLIFLVLHKDGTRFQEFILESQVTDFLKGKPETDWTVYRRVDGLKGK